MKFRQHRMGMDLAESMETMVKIKDRKALIRHLEKRVFCGIRFRGGRLNPRRLSVELYVTEPDRRFGLNWRQTYLVAVKGIGVVGFTDSPC